MRGKVKRPGHLIPGEGTWGLGPEGPRGHDKVSNGAEGPFDTTVRRVSGQHGTGTGGQGPGRRQVQGPRHQRRRSELGLGAETYSSEHFRRRKWTEPGACLAVGRRECVCWWVVGWGGDICVDGGASS